MHRRLRSPTFNPCGPCVAKCCRLAPTTPTAWGRGSSLDVASVEVLALERKLLESQLAVYLEMGRTPSPALAQRFMLLGRQEEWLRSQLEAGDDTTVHDYVAWLMVLARRYCEEVRRRRRLGVDEEEGARLAAAKHRAVLAETANCSVVARGVCPER
ncbi:unnamed protein product [Lampetra fluviatilis]